MPAANSHADQFIHLVGSDAPEVWEHVLSLTSLLSSWGYAVTVVGAPDDEFVRDFHRAGVSTAHLPLTHRPALADQLRTARHLARLMARQPVAVIHAHGLDAGLSALLARSMRSHPPVVCTPNFVPHLVANGFGTLRRAAYRYVLRHCDAIISASATQRDQLLAFQPAVAPRIQVVPYGIDARRYHDPLTAGHRRQLLGVTPTAAVIGCVAHQVPPSSLQLFMDAAAELCRMPNIEFVVIGTDPDHGPHHDMAHQRGLLGATVFAPAQRNPTRLLTALNVLVVLQAGWPGGYLALQALLRGLGVVALPGGEIQEMLHDHPLVTIATAPDPSALREAILARLNTDAQRLRSLEGEPPPAEVVPFLVSRRSWDLDRSWTRPTTPGEGASGELATATAASFGITQMARQTIAVYHRLLDRGTDASPQAGR